MPERESEAKKEDEPVKLEDAAEETGAIIGKGVRKTWSVMKSFGKGLVDAIDSKEKPTDVTVCPHCGAPTAPESSFCSECGEKL